MFSFKNSLLGLVLLGATSIASFGQEIGQDPGLSNQAGTQVQKAYPPVNKIPEGDKMFSKRVWRMIDLREKQNRPMFSSKREITKVIIEAVRRGELPVYNSDSLDAGSSLTREEFLKKLIIPEAGGGLSEEERAAGLTDDWGGGSDWGDDAPKVEMGPSEYFPKQLFALELMEDVVFDKKRSRMYNQIQGITLLIPASINVKAINEPIGTFKYEDLVKVFQNDPEAIWFNPQNDAQHKNLSEAFELRLFNSYIVKVSSPLDDRLDGVGKQGLYAAQRIQEDLIEFEYSLWSY